MFIFNLQRLRKGVYIIRPLSKLASADDLHVDPVLESETNLEYVAGRGAVSPSNPLSEASFERGPL